MSESLNDMCPFGDRSTKHFAEKAKTPDTHLAARANVMILKIINNLSTRLGQQIRLLEGGFADSATYTQFAIRSHDNVEHTPRSFTEIFPVRADRNANHLIDRITQIKTPLAQKLLNDYERYIASGCTTKAAARKTLYDIQHSFFEFKKQYEAGASTFELTPDLDGQQFDPDNNLGPIITTQDLEVLKIFQNIQERFDKEETIQKLNSINIEPYVNIILQIQSALCDEIAKIKQEEPEFFKGNSIAYDEIIVQSEDGQILPNSRFLKIFIHNIGEYLVRFYAPDSDPAMTMKLAMQAALEDNVFYQKICVFRTTEDNQIRFDGIIEKSCPARTAIARIFTNLVA